MVRLPETAAECLAQDSKLLELSENAAGRGEHCEFLQFWEVNAYAVVLGHSSNRALDVDEQACHRSGVPILRRESGGGAVLLGVGCLNYTLVLSYTLRPQLRDVNESYRSILHAVAEAAGITGAVRQGIDLTWRNRKFAGCAQRRHRGVILHHGTILYDFDIEAADEFLRQPRRQPAYRQGRSHVDFLTNAPLHPDFGARLAARFPEATLLS